MENEEEKQAPMEEPTEETAPQEEPEEEKEEHDAVAPGGKCRLCGWKFGDVEPHIASFGALRNEPEKPPEPRKVQMKESDPKACPAISPMGKCPKCGWSGADPDTKDNPHPILLN